MPLDTQNASLSGMSAATRGRNVPFSANVVDTTPSRSKGPLARLFSAIPIFKAHGQKPPVTRSAHRDGQPFHVETMKAPVHERFR